MFVYVGVTLYKTFVFIRIVHHAFTRHNSMNKRTALWFLLVIIIVGIAVRSYHLTARSIWFDEAFTWRLSQFPVTELTARTAADAHPPAYYLLLKSWTWVFGSSLLALRSLSVAGAGLTLLAAYLLAASAWRSRPAGLIAATFFAVSAWQIPFAWETRMYTLGTALTLLTTWLLLRQVRASSSARSSRAVVGWLAYALLAAAFLYVHNLAVLVLGTQALFVVGVLLTQTRARLAEVTAAPLARQALLAFGIGSLLYLPWLPVLVQQMGRVQAGYWVAPITRWSIPETAYRFLIPSQETPPHLASLLSLAFIITAFMWLVVGEKRSRDAAFLITLLVFLPILSMIGMSLVGQSLYQDRFFVFFHAALIVGIAALVARIRFPRLRWAAAVGIVILSLGVSLRAWQKLAISEHPGLAGAMQFLATQDNAHEVYVSSPFIFLPVVFYAQQESTAPASAKLLHDSSDIIYFAGGTVLKEGEVVSLQALTTTAVSSLWIVDTTGFGESEIAFPAPWRRLTRQAFPEVIPFQGEVIVSHYVR